MLNSSYRRHVAHGEAVARKRDATLNAQISDRDRDIAVLLNSSKAIFILRGSLINMCYLSTIAQTFFSEKIRIIC